MFHTQYLRRFAGFKINLLLSLICFWQSLASAGFAQSSSSEILPPLVELSVSNEIPFLIEYSFVLKHRAKYFPISPEDAAKSFDKAMASTKRLADRADKAPMKELYEAYNHLYDIYQFYGKLPWNSETEARIQEMRQLLYRLGEWIYLKENREEPRRQIRVSYLALGISQPAYHQDAVRELIAMRSKLPAQYRPSFHLLTYYFLASAESTLPAAKKHLAQYQKDLTRYERKILAVIQARLDAGIIGEQRSGQAKKDIRQILLNLSEMAKKSRYEGIRNRIDSTILEAWISINNEIDWRRVPISDIAGRSMEMPPGLLERLILEEVREGQLVRGIQVYNRLSQDFAGSPVAGKIDLRRIQLMKQHVEKTQQYELILRAFAELLQKYAPENQQQDQRWQRQVYATLFHEFEGFTIDLLKDAAKQNVPNEKRLSAIQVGQVFVSRFASRRPAVKPVKEELAVVFDLAQKPKEAVQIYLDLAKDEPNKYLPLAIQSQMKAARWPSQPSWVNIPAENQAERAALVKLIEDYHKQLSEQKQAMDWNHLAHLGLLYRHLGAAIKAETLWLENLGRASADDPSHGAFGILLQTFFKAEQWDRVIQIYHISEQQNIVPTFENRTLNSELIYQTALLKRASSYQAQKKHKEALADYVAFSNRFKQDRRRPHVIYQIVQCYRQLDQLDLAIEQIKAMIHEYPNLPITKRAMLEGALWAQSAGGAHLKNAAFLYQRFVSDFAADPMMPKARYQLAQVQLVLQANSDASKNFKAHSLDNRVAKAERVRAALNHIRLEAGLGDLARAMVELEPVLRMADRSQQADYISAQIILARIAAEKQQAQQMNQQEAILMPFIKERPDAAEAIGMLRFYRAESRNLEIPFSQNVESMDNYKSALEVIYQRFIEISKMYDLVCKDGDNSFCHQAYTRTTQFSQDAMDAVGSLMVNTQLEAKQMEHLRSLQNTYLTKLKEFFDYYRRMTAKYENYRAPDIPAGIIAAH